MEMTLDKPFLLDAGEGVFDNRKEGDTLVVTKGSKIVCLRVLNILDGQNAVVLPVKLIEKEIKR